MESSGTQERSEQTPAYKVPMFVWSFVMNVPEPEPVRHPRPKEAREAHQPHSLLPTPCHQPDEPLSAHSRTPFSVVDKMHEFSPFRTTCQKRAESSPLSPGLWRKVNSSLKKPKPSTLTPLSTLFHQSGEKDPAAPDRSNNHFTPLLEHPFFQRDLLLFPDLDRHNYEPLGGSDQFGQDPAYLKALPSFGQPKARRDPPISDPSGRRQLQDEGCNCRNTKCLKLYCECLRKGAICGPHCNCTGCENHAHSDLRKERVRVIEKKNPNAFRPIIVETTAQDSGKVHNKGCNCRRSHCLKNYCECHQFGVMCTEACKCADCQNTEPAKGKGGKGKARRGSHEDGKTSARGSRPSFIQSGQP